MAAEDELALPQVPEAKPDDPEDVSWALSTAEAMWARGDHLEGIKWVRKAAEAASDVEDDERALELAKAASELATIVARRSRASLATAGMDPGPTPSPVAAEPAYVPMSAQPVSSIPNTARSVAPPAPGAWSNAGGNAGAPATRSSPPIPLPSQASQATRAPSPSGRPPPRPLATGEAQAPLVGRGVLPNRTAPKPRRRSRDNLDNEARAAGVIETAPLRAVDGETAERTLEETGKGDDTAAFAHEKPTANGRARRRSRPEPDPTVVRRLEDLVAATAPAPASPREKSAAEWDASPTQNLTGEEMDHMSAEGDRKTTAFALHVPPLAPEDVPARVPERPPVRAPQATVHDPEIQTTQAVRVVVWRDASGVHVAPAGTVVSSITIDAVLVVLEQGADLTAWLSQRER